MTRIARVVTTVVMDDGSEFRLVVHDPAPGGDNPAFVGSQLHVAMDMLERRHFDVLETTYGSQQGRPARPSDELLSPREPVHRGHDGGHGPACTSACPAYIEQRAPENDSLVTFPDVYGDTVFRTINREVGIYEVYIPRGLPKGDHIQINTDAARWEAHR